MVVGTVFSVPDAVVWWMLERVFFLVQGLFALWVSPKVVHLLLRLDVSCAVLVEDFVIPELVVC